MKPLRMLSFCTGIGAADWAAEQTGGIHVVGQIENDPFCQAILAKHWPDVRRLGDLREVRGDEFGPVDLVVGGIPCFGEGTLILTKAGYRPIETIQIGEQVLTHQGRWKPVTAFMKRKRALLYEVQTQGSPGIRTTEEHPFLARYQIPERPPDVMKPGPGWTQRKPGWVPARILNRTYQVAQVLPSVHPSRHQPSWWWVFGWLLAHEQKHGPQSEQLFTQFLQNHPAITVLMKDTFQELSSGEHDDTEGSLLAQLLAVQKALHRWLFFEEGNPGNGALPGWILTLDELRARALLEGYATGNGGQQEADERTNTRFFLLSSKALALSLVLLVQRAYGSIASLRLCSIPPGNDQGASGWDALYLLTIPEQNRASQKEDVYGWQRVLREVRSVGEGTVYNLAVAEDESYVADGIVVHNCQPFSYSGKRRGQSDDRHLWPAAFALVQHARPRWVVIENVPGFIDLALDLVWTDLESEGYEVGAILLPAGGIGAPHLRQRVFVLAHTHCLQWKLAETSASGHHVDGH